MTGSERGVAKGGEVWDTWCREVAPSTELRKWYGHDPARFAEFRRRYLAELRHEPARSADAQLRAQAGAPGIVLVTATRDIPVSAARVLADRLHRSLRAS